MNFITRFLKGNWLEKAKIYAFNPWRMKTLILQLGKYISKKGLSGAKENLLLIRDYLSDIATGKYKDYDVKKLLVVVAAIIYVITPLDFLPDFIPPGLIDDLSIIAWAIKETASELERYKAYLSDRRTQENG
ncbi:MAG: DUF1232 domain-containing protein [Bacteroidaceae bacterium]|nr:DUF1232 domain-containing protein [Bacteroidaceae bacterium]